MLKRTFADEKIIGILKEHQAGVSAGNLCRKHGVSDATFYKWRSKFGGMEVSDARKLNGLEDENRKLSKLLAESMVDNATLKEMLTKKTSNAQVTESGCELGDPGEGLLSTQGVCLGGHGTEDVPPHLDTA